MSACKFRQLSLALATISLGITVQVKAEEAWLRCTASRIADSTYLFRTPENEFFTYIQQDSVGMLLPMATDPTHTLTVTPTLISFSGCSEAWCNYVAIDRVTMSYKHQDDIMERYTTFKGSCRLIEKQTVGQLGVPKF